MLRHSSLLFLLLIQSMVAAAAILPVSTLGDSGAGSLRDQAAAASNGDTLQFVVDGTVVLETKIDLDRDLSIFGIAAGNVVISGSGENRHIEILYGNTLRVRYLTFRDGYTAGLNEEGGGAIKNRGFLYASDCYFVNNRAEVGGAIESVGNGGDTSEVYLDRCSFIGNRAFKVTTISPSIPRGGAIFADSRDGGRIVIFADNCTFSGNETDESGGAVYQLDIPFGSSELRFTACTFTKNSSLEGTGGVDVSQGRFPFIKSCIFDNNTGNPLYPNIRGSIRSLGHNCFSDTTGSILFTGPQVGDIFNQESKVIDLVAFSPRQWMHPLACSSPCINQIPIIDALPLDQRGGERVGLADVGAYERNDDTDFGMTNLLDAGIGTLRFLVQFHCDGDTLELPALEGTISLQSPIAIPRPISIKGNPNVSQTLSGSDSVRIFEVATNGRLYLSNLTLSNGNAGIFGGGAVLNRGYLEIQACTFSWNKATAGGAIANYGITGTTAEFVAHNSTFSRNTAEFLDGGAIDSRSFGGMHVSSINACTFAYNQAFVRGGAILIGSDGELTLSNSLLDLNDAPEGKEIFGSISSNGYNLIRTEEGITSGLMNTDVLDLASEILPLEDNGGPTQTHDLSSNSPAINAGTPGLPLQQTDQRGFPRLVSERQDIGAVEYQGPVSSQQQKWRIDLLIYPQPAKEFYLEIDQIRGRLSVQMINTIGQVVWSNVFMVDSDKPIFISPQLPSGSYFLMVQNADRQHVIRVLIP